MKINALIVNNFMRIRSLDVELGRVTLFAGHNESGKSSALESIRFAATGESPRVGLKKDYKALVHRGQKTGDIMLVTENGEIRRTVKDGKRHDKTDERALYEDSLPFVLGAQGIGGLSYNKRRELFLSMLPMAATPERVRSMLVNRKIDESIIDECLPYLRSGFDQMRDYAADQARESKGAWRSITGESWGQSKADNYVITVPDAPASDPKALAEDIELCAAEMDQVQQSIGAITAQQNAGPSEQDAEDDRLAATLEERTEILAKCRDTLKYRDDTLDWAISTRNTLECPKCQALLLLSDGNLVSSTEVAQCDVPYDQASSEQSEAYEAVETAKKRLQTALDAAERVQAREEKQPQAKDMSGELSRLKDRAIELRDKIAKSRDLLGEHEDATRLRKQAEEDQEKAEAENARIMSWLKLVDEVSPGGIPAELIAESLQPINDRLKATAASTGWPQVVIGSDGSVLVDNMPYELLSESAKWRADTAIAESVAYEVGPRILAIDRVDVLDMPGRQQFVSWLQKLAKSGDYDHGTIVCAGTFKSKPTVPGIGVIWMDKGAQA